MSQDLATLLGKPPAKIATPYDDAPHTEVTAAFPFNTLSNKGRRFTIKSPEGKELAKGKPGASLNGIFLGSAPLPYKSWYAKAYDPENPSAPDCGSENGSYPAAHYKNKQSKTCAGCKWNVAGTASNGKGKACSTNIPVVFVPITKDEPKMQLACVWRINATSAFEKETDVENHIYSFMALNKVLSGNGWKLPNLVVEITHDEDNVDGHLITFKPVMGVTGKMLKVMNDHELLPIARMLSTDPAVLSGDKEPGVVAGDYADEAADNEAEEPETEEEEVEEEEETPPPAPKKKRASKKKAAAKAKPDPEPEEEEEEELEDGSEASEDELGDLGDFELS